MTVTSTGSPKSLRGHGNRQQPDGSGEDLVDEVHGDDAVAPRLELGEVRTRQDALPDVVRHGETPGGQYAQEHGGFALGPAFGLALGPAFGFALGAPPV